MKYWLVIGIKDSRFNSTIASHVDAMSLSFNTQNVIVETGEGIGSWTDDGQILLCHKKGVVPFLNMALQYIRGVAREDDWIVRIDADDYYGPSYLADIDDIRRAGFTATGMASNYVKTEDGRMYLCRGRNGPGSGVPGGTIAGRVKGFLDFHSDRPCGEDTNWCRDMSSAGVHLQGRGPRGYSMCRHAGYKHTWTVRGEEIPHVWLCDAYDLGSWDADKADLNIPENAMFVPPSPRLAVAHLKRNTHQNGQI